jgi:import receptor subunit TOM70
MKKLLEVCLPSRNIRRVDAGIDFTALSIIEGFQNDQSAASVERCLKKVAAKKAKEILEVSGQKRT